jgi:hypothetical protein
MFTVFCVYGKGHGTGYNNLHPFKKKEIPVILRAGYHRDKKNCKVFPETECLQALQFHDAEHKQWKKTILSVGCSSITLEKWEQVFMTKGNFCPD